MTHDVLKAAPTHFDSHKLVEFLRAGIELATKKWFAAEDEGRVLVAHISLLVQVKVKVAEPVSNINLLCVHVARVFEFCVCVFPFF